MTKKVMMISSGIVGLALVAAIAVYAVQKPYQQDRILIELGLKR